jgi:hypothetical protein
VAQSPLTIAHASGALMGPLVRSATAVGTRLQSICMSTVFAARSQSYSGLPGSRSKAPSLEYARVDNYVMYAVILCTNSVAAAFFRMLDVC